MNKLFTFIVLLSLIGAAEAQVLLIPDRVFDGESMHDDWTVVISENKIIAAGKNSQKGFKIKETIQLKGQTLLPGMIEGHSHLLLYPYDETSWNDQVLLESQAERVARATVHARKTLWAGFTTVRDLGSEGAGYADIGLKNAIDKGVIPGPRMLVAGPALVATGSYGPKGFSPDHIIPKGAQEADGLDLYKAVREQIGAGVDLIKVYADYRWGINDETKPTYTLTELKTIVDIASQSGRPVVAHAYSSQAIKQAVYAGVETIEHAGEGTLEDFQLMRDHGVAICLTIGATEAISTYRGWKKGTGNDPTRIIKKRISVAAAIKSGVTIIAGGDVGVFDHGDNVYELELMVEYGMSELAVLKAVTAINAKTFRIDDRLGRIRPGHLADLVSVEGNPLDDISDLRNVRLVVKAGKTELNRQ